MMTSTQLITHTIVIIALKIMHSHLLASIDVPCQALPTVGPVVDPSSLSSLTNGALPDSNALVNWLQAMFSFSCFA